MTDLKKGEIYLEVKDDGRMIPLDGLSAKRHARMKRNTPFLFSFSERKNLRFHKKYFALLKMCFDNQEFFSDFDVFRKHTLIKIGWCDVIVDPFTGMAMPQAKSISFDGCTVAEFDKVYKKTIAYMMKQYCYDDNFFNRLRSYD